MIIAVDFDGTCTTHDYPNIGKDIGAIPVLKKLIERGHRIILWTMRDNKGEVPLIKPEGTTMVAANFLGEAVEWFADNNIPLYGVQINPEQHRWTQSPKVYAQVYIDDAALGCPLKWDSNLSERPFVDWQKVEQLLIEQEIL